jgi:hypothetical protein
MLLNLQRILVALIFLFATLYANYWFTVIAYPRNIKSNTSGNPYSSNAAASSSDHGNNLPTLHYNGYYGYGVKSGSTKFRYSQR